MKLKRRSQSPLTKKARRGFRGSPVATVACYAPNDTRATKVAVAIVLAAGAEPAAIERWFAEDRDVRSDSGIGLQISAFIARHGVKSVVMADRILGCPHEEGVGYPVLIVAWRCGQNLV
jgi:hypothetical protein